VTRTYRC